jgi:hypothetical protein
VGTSAILRQGPGRSNRHHLAAPCAIHCLRSSLGRGHAGDLSPYPFRSPTLVRHLTMPATAVHRDRPFRRERNRIAAPGAVDARWAAHLGNGLGARTAAAPLRPWLSHRPVLGTVKRRWTSRRLVESRRSATMMKPHPLQVGGPTSTTCYIPLVLGTRHRFDATGAARPKNDPYQPFATQPRTCQGLSLRLRKVTEEIQDAACCSPPPARGSSPAPRRSRSERRTGP